MLSIDSIGALTKKEAMEIIGQGPAVITFYLLEMSKALSEARRELERKDELISGLSASKKEREISTPSGAKPVYEKENTRRKGRKRPGRKAGHKGERRATPSQVDNEETLSLSNCPDCGTELEDVDERERFVEDIKKQKPEVTKIKIRRGYCKNCDKIVEPKVTAALPRCNIGINLVALTAWLHYGLGITISRILEVLNYHLQFQLSQGGLVQIWKRLRNILKPWYDAIVEEAKNSAFLHGDETGWRVDGLGYWLWCFTNNNLTCYMIDRSRGHPALYRFFGEVFKGVLITDFWRAYDKFCSFRQACFVHLFREIAKVSVKNTSDDWACFKKKLIRWMRDAMRLDKNQEITDETKESRKERLHKRLEKLTALDLSDPDCIRIQKRLTTHQDDLLTFLDYEDVTPDNNKAEREVRPGVLMRKNSFHNMSDDGADVQAILMTIFRTLKIRGYNPIDVIVGALIHYIEHDELPPFPKPITSCR